MELSPFLVTFMFVGCAATECRGPWHNVEDPKMLT